MRNKNEYAYGAGTPAMAVLRDSYTHSHCRSLTVSFRPPVLQACLAALLRRTKYCFVLFIAALNASLFAAPPMVSAGCCQTYLLRTDGSVWAWGNNSSGRLGNGNTLHQPYPAPMLGGSNWTSVVAGGYHVLLLRSDGSVWAAGDNAFGQLGTGDLLARSQPTQINGLSNIIALAGGSDFSLALRSDGTVWAWGNNNRGQLGDGTTTNRATPVQAINLSSPVVKLSGGAQHALALLKSGSVVGWGDNSYHQLDVAGSAASFFTSATAVSPKAFNRAVAVYAGDTISAVIQTDGSVWSQGNLSTDFASQVIGIKNAKKLLGYDGGLAALTADGRIWVVGDNGRGALANGTTASQSTPKAIDGLVNIVDVALGSTHGVAVDSSNQVWSWGFAAHGQMGNGVQTENTRPQPAPGFSGAAQLLAGVDISMALDAQGGLTLSGNNLNGQQFDGTTLNRILPAPLKRIPLLSSVATTKSLVMGLTTTGQLIAWGDNPLQLLVRQAATGANSNITTLTGVPIFTQFALGSLSDTAIALANDGTVWTWGENANGQLGDGSTKNNGTPRAIAGLSKVVQVAEGAADSYALKQDGSVWGWGYNQSGQLADASNTPHLTPIQIPGLSNIVRIFARGWYAAALDKDGNLFAWGDNYAGLLCTGDENPRDKAIRVASNVRLVATGTWHLHYLDQSGNLYGCGYNEFGQLGDGTVSNRSKPVLVGKYPTATGLSAGMTHTLLLTDKEAYAWGNNYSGALGTGALLFANMPAQVMGANGKGWLSADAKLVPASPSPFQINAQVNGNLDALTLDFSLHPAEVDRGRSVNIYLVAVFGSALLAHNGQGWVAVNGANLPACATWSLLERQTVPVVRRVDLRGVAGARLYLGYGASLDELIKNQSWAAVYTVPNN